MLIRHKKAAIWENLEKLCRRCRNRPIMTYNVVDALKTTTTEMKVESAKTKEHLIREQPKQQLQDDKLNNR